MGDGMCRRGMKRDEAERRVGEGKGSRERGSMTRLTILAGLDNAR